MAVRPMPLGSARPGPQTRPRYGFVTEGDYLTNIEYPQERERKTWADALSRIALTGEVMVVHLPVHPDEKEARRLRKVIRASINRTARRRIMRVSTEWDMGRNLLMAWAKD